MNYIQFPREYWIAVIVTKVGTFYIKSGEGEITHRKDWAHHYYDELSAQSAAFDMAFSGERFYAECVNAQIED